MPPIHSVTSGDKLNILSRRCKICGFCFSSFIIFQWVDDRPKVPKKKTSILDSSNGVANPWILHLAQIGQEAIGITLDSHDIVGLNTGLIFKDLVHAAALLATQTMGLPCRSDNAELAVYVSSLSWLDVCCVFSCWRANIWMLFVIRCGHKAFS